MATFTQSHRLLFSVAASGLGGTALALLLAARNYVTLAGAVSSVADPSSLVDPDLSVCRTSLATDARNMMLRLAQTEVPRAEMSAAGSATAFAETEPPLRTRGI
jgi:hypothetical protein